MPPLYTADVHVTGGRGGRAVSSDGRLDLRLAPPKELGGDGEGTDPEQLFAAGFAACWLSALGVVARRRRLELRTPAIESSVDLDRSDDGFSLGVRFTVLVEPEHVETVTELVPEVSGTCPYSRAVAGNIDVTIDVQAAG